MERKVAAESRIPDPLPTMHVLSAMGRPFRRKQSVPGGMMHLYVEGAPTTGCGLALETLTLFPEIDWPGGAALSNPRCGACGEVSGLY